ncbi:MAG: threonine--tRNA ligase [Candidatus Kerfeldbacteria bacterium RIFCSPHIGHO2_12_FULL_48_17]|uniref:Threonine--tRNA ligase n=1 Tax=Candidatus Kerfeldbacteria bacterium RIFCSPHIGHO2_12_FULL_48_17 TaxID=1798542 RepID=A0A1G2AXL2_9BACT|nr:MAG: threonine--tRNA ligase [Candidatus Kerfeldbacteria bacterium RIFCSPHIGHO2_12_FULL_48_17]
MTVRNPNDPIEVKRHSFAHLTAAAVLRLWPGSRLGVGPVIDDGFYHDVQVPDGGMLAEEDLRQIEAEVRKMIAEKQSFKREMKKINDAITWLKERGQVFTQELAEDLKASGEKEVSFYSNGEFANMCTGPHVKSTKELDPQAFSLARLAGVFWKSDSSRPQIQRIYGVAFGNKKDLKAYFAQQEAAKKRDHRKIGKELDLFTFSPLVGAGLPLFTPRGTLLRRLIEDYISSLQEPLGYERVWIPHLAKSDLYKTSGHWDKFKDDLFHVRGKYEKTEFVMKPMNCPHHTQIYASRPRSYRDLPLRLCEFGVIYRDEQPGELQGLSRVRSITQDDGHVFCRPDQISEEAKKVYGIVQEFYRTFGIPLKIRLSVRDQKAPEKYLGTDEIWNTSEKLLRQIIEDEGDDFEVAAGEAAFYGPKIDFMGMDSLRRQWQVATIQLDFNQPQRFGLKYQDKDGTQKEPVMIHRAIAGSIERFLSMMIEHFGGDFPVWLSPVQVALLPVKSAHNAFAEKVATDFRARGIRVEVYSASDTIGKKITIAVKQKIPYILVLGDKEIESGMFSARNRGFRDTISLVAAEFLERVAEKARTKSLEL